MNQRFTIFANQDILSSIAISQQSAFQRLAQEALDICHFIKDKPECIQACCECLLSYSNQLDQALLDRRSLREYLEKLTKSQLERHVHQMSRQEQYQILLSQTDPNSDFERIVLEEIYQRGVRLPDTAQELIQEANVKPDFIYREKKIAIFCNGSVHDLPSQREKDKLQRENL